MKVKDVMTGGTLNSCTPETSITKVVKTMTDYNLGALPVVDNKKKVIGMITDRDICLSLGKNPAQMAKTARVKDVLPATTVYTVKAGDAVKNVYREMRKHKVGRLPVTDEKGRLKGIVSINNLLNHALKNEESLGKLKSKSENLARSVKALFDRNTRKQKSRKVVA